MKYLHEADKLRDQQHNALADAVMVQLHAALLSLIGPHVRNRKVEFDDSMGSTSVTISHRRGGHYVINSCDVWWSPGTAEVSGYTAVHNPEEIGWIKDVMVLVSEYNDLADRTFALSFPVLPCPTE